MSQYEADIATAGELIKSQGSNWNVDPENVARMKAQNRFRTGLDIANVMIEAIERKLNYGRLNTKKKQPEEYVQSQNLV